jgi:hypothetical protein
MRHQKFGKNTPQNLYLSPRQRREIVPWLHNLATWTHAITLTLRRSSICAKKPITQTIAVDAIRHYISRIDVGCYGHNARRKGLYVPSVVTLDWGSYGEHPHVHLSFVRPNEMSFDDFTSLIEKSAHKTYWVDDQIHIKAYKNEGWMNYIADHGVDNLLLPFCRPCSAER